MVANHPTDQRLWDHSMSTNKLVAVTGPSGVGKGTLVRALLARHPELYLSVSATTRTPRPGEINGKDYYFVTLEQFQEMMATGQLLEWAEYAGNYYGTPRLKVEEQLNEGRTVILEIELIGARAIKQNFPQVLRLFILPPSLEELECRLRGRGNVPEAAIKKRLERARDELAASDEFDEKIVNESVETALEAIEAAIFDDSRRQD